MQTEERLRLKNNKKKTKQINKEFPREKQSLKEYRSPGNTPLKEFCTLMTRYGIKGYHLCRFFQEVYADVIFKDSKKLLRIGVGFTNDEIVYLESLGWYPLSIEDQMSTEWIECIAWVLGKNIKEIKPVRKYMLLRATQFETDS